MVLIPRVINRIVYFMSMTRMMKYNLFPRFVYSSCSFVGGSFVMKENESPRSRASNVRRIFEHDHRRRERRDRRRTTAIVVDRGRDRRRLGNEVSEAKRRDEKTVRPLRAFCALSTNWTTHSSCPVGERHSYSSVRVVIISCKFQVSTMSCNVDHV